MTIHIVNGPNLNLVGKREPEIYGNVSLNTYLANLTTEYSGRAEIKLFQSNSEGALIDYLQDVGFDESAHIIINAGALGHTSLGLGDCIKAISAPVVDVHISNVHARESFRQNSFVTPAAVGSISGLGLEGYRLAVEWYLGNKTI